MLYPWNDPYEKEPPKEQFVHLEPDVEEFEKENSPHERVLAVATEIAKVSKESFKKRLEDGTATETIHPVYKLDMVNHPPHYTFGNFEVIDVLLDWFPDDPLLWQVGKYIARASHKGDYLENLLKAQFYLNKRIEICQKSGH